MKKYNTIYFMLVFVGFISYTQREIKPPNIVVIMVDDMATNVLEQMEILNIKHEVFIH